MQVRSAINSVSPYEQILRQIDTRRVDFNDPEQVAAFARELIRRADLAGLFAGKNQDKPLLPHIRKSAKEWLFQVDQWLPKGSPASLLRILAHYDLLHRIAYGEPAPGEKIDPTILALFQAHLLGDTTIDQYDLYRLLWSRIQTRDPRFLGRPLQWCTRQLAQWHKNLKAAKAATLKEEIAAGNQSEYDLRNQAEILLSSDLRALEPRTAPAYRRHLTALLAALPRGMENGELKMEN